ncbi:MAG: 16S rRNA (cytosine(1402)-N(4))-methyltransferase RsmH [Lachnospiraceae bacterium]|nr:16S rRNA (cytosine(1402)-N(4))-methyltransferase RsmH [Lachnospiraceae bacterium]
MEFSHTPVLLKECLEALAVREDGIYADGTLGGAGHASRVLEQLSPKGLLAGIDRDGDALKAAGERLEAVRRARGEEAGRVLLIRDNFGNLPKIRAEYGLPPFDGILLDLGVSSYQLDNRERGFSYLGDAPLDMRMDRDQSLTAEIIVNEYPEERLKKILYEYGEERFAPLIVRQIALRRRDHRITSGAELVELIEAAIPAKYRQTGGHPAKRTFQALRIECNAELSVLEDSLPGIIDCLAPGGRLAVITFHSLEDRIVKNAMRTAQDPCICPKDFPVCVCGRTSRGRVVTRKPILPSLEETAANSRSKSAKLRVFEHC